ncbi:hypothetical protein AGRA3207_005824 [Actinomadura graeca]|uniref:Integral membrane protein n=1 Tax=Actinomadura graeca TaxID=2750812 RepID=A0ABX8R2K5_9ACTN|nr:DUF6113 family protein [Actinomadura graeca]QXJ24489.1 hypothetical protein AGRA3207_005824 [Actinomadura graeca]
MDKDEAPAPPDDAPAGSDAPPDGDAPAGAAPRPGEGPVEAFVSGAAYAALGLLGGIAGLLGSFAQDWSPAGVPVVAAVLVALVFAMVRLSGWGMGGRLGATIPAIVWGVVVFALSLQRPEGDLVVSANLSGYLYIIGGMAAAVLGVMRVPAAGPPGQWLLGRAARNRP